MKKSLCGVVFVVALFMFVVTGGNALASTASSNVVAELQWDSLVFSVSGGITLTWNTQYTSQGASVGPVLPPTSVNGWVDNTVTASGPFAAAQSVSLATASPFTLGSYTQNGLGTSALSYASAERGGTFTIGGTGVGTVSIFGPYNSDVDLSTSGIPTSAYGTSYIQLFMDKNAGTGGDYATNSTAIYVSQTVSDGATFTHDQNGVAGVILGYKAGDVGSFYAYTHAEGQTTVVPIPGAMWLLGSGLVGLVGIRRRFWK